MLSLNGRVVLKNIFGKKMTKKEGRYWLDKLKYYMAINNYSLGKMSDYYFCRTRCQYKAGSAADGLACCLPFLAVSGDLKKITEVKKLIEYPDNCCCVEWIRSYKK